MVRSILAVLSGIATLTATSWAIDEVALPYEKALGPVTIFLFLYTTACVIFGGYVTAWIARCLEVRHALIMGFIQAGLTVLAMLSFGGEFPLRNWIVSILLAVPAAWCGGVLRARRRA